MKIEIKGLDEVRASLKMLSDSSFKRSMATALTRTAVQARDAVKQAMPTALDRPTPYTMRSIKYTAASENRLQAEVGVDVEAIRNERGSVTRYESGGDTPASKYLQFQVDGGQRARKRFEVALQSRGLLPPGWFAVPGQRAKMTPYGNQSVGELKQILSFFDSAEPYSGSTQNMGPAGRAKRLKGTKKRAGFEYVAIAPGAQRAFKRSQDARGHWSDKGMHKMQPGIYRRTYHALGTQMEPMIIFVRRATYKPRFDFYAIANRVVSTNLRPEMDRAVEQSLQRLAARGG